MDDLTTCLSPVGRLTLAARDGFLIGLWIEGQKYFGSGLGPEVREDAGNPVLTVARNWLDRYFAGERPSPDELPLKPVGSDFRQNVWSLLREIPYGHLATYGGLARQMAEKMRRPGFAGQAIGGAVGHNPISIIIPCHRVVGANGSLTGYAGGIDVKSRLLEIEGVDLSRLTIPRRAAGDAARIPLKGSGFSASVR